ncbi:MAG: hypothetical protein WBI12_06575 [Methanosarcina flavescens]|jgi:hypothetical protein|uniref:Uncharacterized protein n=1 Tax=Methanosarcina flavescens TaxID=1715806 RepID=A0A660HQP2_9EURY|nr:hypothetical protein AOB57_004875 [Methanosarcina flavescens]NLK32455.1 hypothetical protein [Methanosarcina flavescens]
MCVIPYVKDYKLLGIQSSFKPIIKPGIVLDLQRLTSEWKGKSRTDRRKEIKKKPGSSNPVYRIPPIQQPSRYFPPDISILSRIGLQAIL